MRCYFFLFSKMRLLTTVLLRKPLNQSHFFARNAPKRTHKAQLTLSQEIKDIKGIRRTVIIFISTTCRANASFQDGEQCWYIFARTESQGPWVRLRIRQSDIATASELTLMLCIFYRYYNVFKFVTKTHLAVKLTATVFATKAAHNTRNKKTNTGRPRQTNSLEY